MTLKRVVYVLNAGKLSYQCGLKLQNHVSYIMKNNSELGNQKIDGLLILVEHKPVYTIGIRRKNYDSNYEKKLQELGADFFRINRGGLVTFHGPGQLVMYPILNLKKFHPSVRLYVSQLEKTVIGTCKDFGITANTSPHTGVWVNDKKICAMGIRVNQYITSHGLALNCETDLKWFDHIVPCGIADKGVTSMTNECGITISINDALPKLVENFKRQFCCEVQQCPLDVGNNLLDLAKTRHELKTCEL